MHRIQLIFRFSGYFCFLEQNFRKRNCKFIDFIQSSIIGKFKKVIYKHIGGLFILLSLTEYIEYPLLFRFSGYFCFLEQQFRERNCKLIDFMQSPILGKFKNINYKQVISLFIPLMVIEYKEYPLLIRFSGYFCFLEQKFRRRNSDFIDFMHSPKSGKFKIIIYKHIGSLFIALKLTEYIEYQLIFRFAGYFCFLEQKHTKVKCKSI